MITTEANALVADIHGRMPVVLRPEDYDRWLGIEPDPRDLLRPFPAELMRLWLISTRVNAPKNDDPDSACACVAGQQQHARTRTKPAMMRFGPCRSPSMPDCSQAQTEV